MSAFASHRSRVPSARYASETHLFPPSSLILFPNPMCFPAYSPLLARFMMVLQKRLADPIASWLVRHHTASTGSTKLIDHTRPFLSRSSPFIAIISNEYRSDLPLRIGRRSPSTRRFQAWIRNRKAPGGPSGSCEYSQRCGRDRAVASRLPFVRVRRTCSSKGGSSWRFRSDGLGCVTTHRIGRRSTWVPNDGR